ncbi:hypothetical protein ASL14_17375 [Paenibacillus sp. IHB B 3084]|uniref:hypothetical protein n=1 Tax=Paenibacillus sp. IHB B 3084 TaxID=867076 RepID=UPI0007222799|nr:hypothetical protein [Paenibacillus sp. IHB B 3084]ALP37700.1 hypothetical protein ASL14_17375 [Paenibacillus sp. IHB B 3084]
MGSTIRLRSGTKVTFKFHLYIRSFDWLLHCFISHARVITYNIMESDKMDFIKSIYTKQNINTSVLFFAFLVLYSVFSEIEIKPIALLLFTVVFAFFNALSKFVQSTRSDNDLK